MKKPIRYGELTVGMRSISIGAPAVKLSICLFLLLLIIFGYFSQFPKNDKHDFGNKIEEIRFSYNPESKFWGENLYRRSYGNIVCEGNSITSVSSRIFTNFLDLEFYCRDTTKDITLKHTVLPKPTTSLIGVSIQNYEGQLYSVTSGEIFDFDAGRWVSDKNSLRDLYLLQPYQNSWAKIQWQDSQCNGLIINIHGHEYCIESNNVSAVLVWNNKVYVNDAGDLLVYEIPKPERSSSNRIKLSASHKYDGEDWSYFIVPVQNGDDVIWGGTSGSHRTPVRSCPPIHVNQKPHRIEYADCRPHQITEWYATTRIDGIYFLGNFPDGSLKTINADLSKIEPTSMGLYADDDWEDRVLKSTYRESQAVSYGYGYIWIGMYPWGELIRSDLLRNGKESSTRLFSHPSKNKNIPAPYFDSYLTVFGDTDKRRSLKEIGYSFTDEAVKSLRKKTIEPTHLGQRVPSISILDGRVCASTGNFNQIKPDSKVLQKLKIANINEYGKVHCLELPNHALVKSDGDTNFRIEIYQRGLKIFSGGEMSKIVRFSDLEIN